MASTAAAAVQGRLAPPPRLPDGAALFLDFDGTLAPIAPRPEAVRVAAELPPLLAALRERLGGALAIVTGRRLRDVDHHLAPFLVGGAGLHGAELRPHPGTESRLQWNPDTTRLVAALRARFAADPRVLIEDKDASVALHYRQAPERAQDCRSALLALAPTGDFEIITGSMVVEARPRGAGKGRAVLALCAQPPFRGRTPVFVGDDITDEDGFTAAAQLGGFGVKIGPGTTVARHRLDSVAALAAWLRDALGTQA